MDDSIKQVIQNVVKNHNGKLLLYGCRDRILIRPAISQHILNHNNLTIQDILQRRRKNSQMTFTVLGR